MNNLTAGVFLLNLIFCKGLLADFEFKCKEIERITVADSGLMTPAYPGRKLEFTVAENTITGTGVFYHEYYDISHFKDTSGHIGFRAFANNSDRQDIFFYSNNKLFHSAIVNYGSEPSIQSEIFECNKSFND